MRHPQKSDGFIDEDELFSLIVGTLKLCSVFEYHNFTEQFTLYDVGLLSKQKMKDDNYNYEMIKNSVRIGYISAKNNKHIPMFKDEKEQKTYTPTEKQDEMNKLKDIMGGA